MEMSLSISWNYMTASKYPAVSLYYRQGESKTIQKLISTYYCTYLLGLFYSSIIIFHWLLVNRLFTKTPTCCSLDEQHLTQVLKFNSRLISDWLKLSAHYSLPSSMSRDMKAGRSFYFLFIQANRAGKTSLLYTGNYWFLFLN